MNILNCEWIKDLCILTLTVFTTKIVMSQTGHKSMLLYSMCFFMADGCYEVDSESVPAASLCEWVNWLAHWDQIGLKSTWERKGAILEDVHSPESHGCCYDNTAAKLVMQVICQCPCSPRLQLSEVLGLLVFHLFSTNKSLLTWLAKRSVPQKLGELPLKAFAKSRAARWQSG